MKRSSKKGFTLAELLIVIAIIAVLIAIMFPVFSAQIDKARAAADLANVRAAYAEEVADAMLGDSTDLTAQTEHPVVNFATLAKAMQYEGSTVTYTPGEEGAVGTIEVAYGTQYKGSFKIDADVVVSSDDTSEEAKVLKTATTYNNKAEVPA